MKLLLFFVFSTACLATYIRIINKGNDVNVFQERKFVEGEWVSSDKNMNTLTLYISNYKRDRTQMQLQSKKESNQQGGQMSNYSKQKKKEHEF